MTESNAAQTLNYYLIKTRPAQRLAAVAAHGTIYRYGLRAVRQIWLRAI